MKFFILLSLISCFIYFSCSPDGSVDSDRPVKPSMVTRTDSSDLKEIERGIDADSSPTDDIVIMWHKHPETLNLEKYILWRGEEVRGQLIFSNIQDIQANFNLDTIYVDKGLMVGTRYYYFILAVDQNNNRSVPSDTVRYQLLEKPELEDLTFANTLDNPTSLIFRTKHFTAGASAGSILRIEEPGSRRLVYLEYIPQFQNADGIAVHIISGDTLQKLFNDDDDGSSYEWRIDLADDFGLFRGSESEWQEFSINWGN